MKTNLPAFTRSAFLRFLCLFAAIPIGSALRAADDKVMAALRAADDERTAATKSGDRARLDAIFSDELHYAHSSGKVDTKASYMDSLVKRATIYEKFDFKQRDFRVVAPGLALMTGRVVITANVGGDKQTNDLNFLAVWREEKGKWRFLAWQSCKNPPAADGKK